MNDGAYRSITRRKSAPAKCALTSEQTLRICFEISDAFGPSEIGPLLARRQDMPKHIQPSGIMGVKRQRADFAGSLGTGRISARGPNGAASQKACGAQAPRRLPLLTLAEIRSRQMRH